MASISRKKVLKVCRNVLNIVYNDYLILTLVIHLDVNPKPIEVVSNLLRHFPCKSKSASTVENAIHVKSSPDKNACI